MKTNPQINSDVVNSPEILMALPWLEELQRTWGRPEENRPLQGQCETPEGALVGQQAGREVREGFLEEVGFKDGHNLGN